MISFGFRQIFSVCGVPMPWSLGGKYWLVQKSRTAFNGSRSQPLHTLSLKVCLLPSIWCLSWVVLGKLMTMSFTEAPSVLPVIAESACVYHQMIFLNCIPFAVVALSRQTLTLKVLYRCTWPRSLLVPKYSLGSLSAWVTRSCSFSLRYVLNLSSPLSLF